MNEIETNTIELIKEEILPLKCELVNSIHAKGLW